MRRAQGIFRTGSVWRSFVAAGSLLLPHTGRMPFSRPALLIVFSTVPCCWCLLSPLQPSVFSQANSFPFPLHWPLPTLLPLPGFGKRARVSVSLVLAVGKVIKRGMKRDRELCRGEDSTLVTLKGKVCFSCSPV